MKPFAWILLPLVFFFAGIADSAEKRIIAVPEFQNKSDRIVSISRWDLAVWTANDLKKTGEFAPIDRKKINSVVKDATYADDRMREIDEEKLRSLSAQYVLYGTVRTWDATNSAAKNRDLGGPDETTVAPAVLVVLSFDLVDLSTGKVVKSFYADGSSIGSNTKFDPQRQPDLDEDKRYEQIFEDASKYAIRREPTNQVARFCCDEN